MARDRLQPAEQVGALCQQPARGGAQVVNDEVLRAGSSAVGLQASRSTPVVLTTAHADERALPEVSSTGGFSIVNPSPVGRRNLRCAESRTVIGTVRRRGALGTRFVPLQGGKRAQRVLWPPGHVGGRAPSGARPLDSTERDRAAGRATLVIDCGADQDLLRTPVREVAAGLVSRLKSMLAVAPPSEQ